MGITGLLPFIDKASRRANVSEFSGCTVAIDSYCWLHKGAFACADKLVRGEDTDIHIKYCMKYVSMLLSRNIKPILVFDGRHLPAKAMTEEKRRESRNISKKRAAELLSLGQIEEARSYMRRSVDITHKMALDLIKECRKRNVDCIVAPYEADSQLAYLNTKGFAHLVITEDSDLILFGCSKVLFKMDLDGAGTLVDTTKLPLVMKCPIERYTFDKFRQMCIMSGCDYLASLPGIGLAKARQFVTATQDTNFANALKKLPSFFNKSSLVVSDEYRENFLKAEATFKHQYVYDPIRREMVRLTECDDDELEEALCCNAGERLDPNTAFQLALGNLDPFTLRKMDDWHPDIHLANTISKDSKLANHASIWTTYYKVFLNEESPWKKKKLEPILPPVKTRAVKKVVNLVEKYVPETEDQNLSIEVLSNMYCAQPANKKTKIEQNTQSYDSQEDLPIHEQALNEDDILKELTQKEKSPILENRKKSYKKSITELDTNIMGQNNNISEKRTNIMRKLSRFPRTVLDSNVVESKFFSSTKENDNNCDESQNEILDTQELESVPLSRNPFKIRPAEFCRVSVMESNKYSVVESNKDNAIEPDNNIFVESNKMSVIETNKVSVIEPKISIIEHNEVSLVEPSQDLSEDFVENTYPMETLVTPVDSQTSYGTSSSWRSSAEIPSPPLSQPTKPVKKPTFRVSGLKRTTSLPSNQPTLLSKFGFQKRPAMKR